jgi:hypothetical protein
MVQYVAVLADFKYQEVVMVYDVKLLSSILIL